MPAKIVFDKEKVAAAAYRIIERDGLAALNARSLAKESGCSTQPIYLRYPDMSGVKADADKIIRKVYGEYLQNGLKTKPSLYAGYLTAYVKFAAEKPNLFAYLFMRPTGEEKEEDKALRKGITEAIARLGGYSIEIADKFFFASWLFAHGIACQIATGYIKWDENTVEKMLDENFCALKKYYGGIKNDCD